MVGKALLTILRHAIKKKEITSIFENNSLLARDQDEMKNLISSFYQKNYPTMFESSRKIRNSRIQNLSDKRVARFAIFA